ncbi:hypothetical protein ACFX2I_000343 [Malus domestica]
MRKLNWALVKSLYVENQVWRDLAQTNEAIANALCINLEQVLAHQANDDDNRQSDANAVVLMDDAQSCYGSSGRDEGRNDGVGELDRLPISVFFRLTSVCKRWKSGASSPSFKLASIITDEDLDNMVEEYDRTASTFPYKPFCL